MKIYTKTGDDGTTSLLGGNRVKKHDLRIEAYGTVDELNAQIGVVRSAEITEEIKTELIGIQTLLFTIGSQLATPADAKNIKIPNLAEADITLLECAIDRMEEELEPMRNFILPGGNSIVAHAHVARCVCRRAERQVLLLSEGCEIPNIILMFLNRLSDYLFVLSRKLSKDLDAEEIPWIPNKRQNID